MKIALPASEKSLNTAVCPSFGRAPYFCIYDTEAKASSFLDNSAAASQGGAGIKAAQVMVDNHVDVLLTPRCGQNAADVIKAANVQIYKTMNASLQENIDAFQVGKLGLLDEIHPGFHHHGGQ